MLHTGLCVIMSPYTAGLPRFPSRKSFYRVHLDQERRKKETDEQGKKRKALEDHLEELKKKRKTVNRFLNVWPEMQTGLQKRLRARRTVRWPSS